MKSLAKSVLEYLKEANIPAVLVDVKEVVFANGEYCPKIEESVRNTTVYLFFSPHEPDPTGGMMRLAILLNALNHASPDRVKCVLPYIPYLRQDRKAEARTPITAQLVANIIQMYPIVRNLITMDMHAEQIQGFFHIPTDNLYGRKVLAEYLGQKFAGSYDQLVVVAPDVNSAKRAQEFAQHIDPSITYCIVDKRRYKANESEVVSFVGGDITNKIAVMVDDMIDTAGTLVGAAQELRRRGASDVVACATHGVFGEKDGISGATRLLHAGIQTIITNSIPRTKMFADSHADNLTILPIDRMIAETVAADCRYGGSVSVLNKKR
jgi:ribose-phosphate pyrophosphokinase